MITQENLRAIAAARLHDAQVLLEGERYDGAVYIGGYAVELSLKARICDTLDWRDGFPETNKEFEKLASFRIHDLERLLHLSGREFILKEANMADWSIVIRWNPEDRYKTIGQTAANDARAFVKSVTALLPNI